VEEQPLVDKTPDRAESDAGEATSGKMSRGKFVAAAGVAGAAIATGGLPGVAQAKPYTASKRNRALQTGLAPGKIGGPVGFQGAARYQYGPNDEEGRAMQALQAMKKAGNAPDQLVVQVLNFARPQFDIVYPQGAKETIAQLFERETGGIKIQWVETDPATEFQTNIRNASTKNGSFDVVTGAIEDTGDYATSGLLLPLDKYVAKYKPSWNDPVNGYLGGAPVVNLFNKFEGRTYWVAFDNDTQPYVYRTDLFNTSKEKANFEDKYGYPLAPPKTWDEQADIAAFFNRPKAATPLFGSVERKGAFWGKVNWQHRFVCSADPNMYYFKPDGSANVNNTAGIRATTEHLRSLQWSEPGNLTKDWISQYQLFGAGNGLQGGTFANVTKLVVPANKDFDKGFGKYLRTDVQPGRMVNGKLVRRVAIHYNISYGVNAFAPQANHEAAYLFLQWAGGRRMFTYLTANPGGYQDPHHKLSMVDPLVVAGYGAQPMRAFQQIVPRQVPPITIRGAGEYNQALDEELQKVMTKQQSPEKAMKNVSDRWDKITERLGQARQAKAVVNSYKAFPPKGRYGPNQKIT
jgi:multiple sugar transport system substrate-binding protein